MITFQEEQFQDCIDEGLPLLLNHYKEVALDQNLIPLDIDFDGYLALQSIGRLFILTVRDGGKLIGYQSVIVGPSLHYKTTIFGDTDIFYVSPNRRGGMIGKMLFLETEKRLKSRGVTKVLVDHKLHIHPYIGKILEHIGYQKIEHRYAKTL